MPTTITNPVLRGFAPDPSILRIGDVFYVAVSTFEWYPGVQIWESRDLQTFRMCARPLAAPELLDMQGVQSSGGVWAPALSVQGDRIWLIYSLVRAWRGETPHDYGAFKDTLNYVTSAPSVEGPWETPVLVTAGGFDPSLFHDDDGRSWYLRMEWDYRGDPTHFSGIMLSEFDRESMSAIGTPRRIFTTTELDRVEGPHIYKKDGWYYLFCAEGGTSYEHAVTVARSRSIEGPYELHPANPLVSSLEDRRRDLARIRSLAGEPDPYYPERTAPTADAAPPPGFFDRPQKAGHGSIAPLADGEWVLAHLCGRPLRPTPFCPLGRETALERLVWRDEWPWVVDADGEHQPLAAKTVTFSWEPSPDVRRGAAPVSPGARAWLSTDTEIVEDFSGPELHPALRFLRSHPGSNVSLTATPGALVLAGREGPTSVLAQTIVAHSVGAYAYEVETVVDFAPRTFQQMAGLIVRYDERNQYYLRICGADAQADLAGGRTIGVIRFAGGRVDLPVQDIVLPTGPIALRLQVDGTVGRFSWRRATDTGHHPVPVELDMLQLSDERAWPEGFTGTFAGMAAHDLTGGGATAAFTSYQYREREEQPHWQ